MLRETALVWWHLGILSKKRYDLLVQLYGDLDGALADMSEDFLRKLKVKEETVRDSLDRLGDLDLGKLEERMRRDGVTLCTWEDDEYPAILREVPDAPVFLSYKGDLSLLKSPMVGVVGTRAMTQYGKRATIRFVDGFVDAGITTVSGLAGGVDTIVAEETLKMGGKTVAVLGTGLAVMFPSENEPLSGRIVESGSLILSEFPLFQNGTNHTFPARNRIIAGLSRGTLVVEAPLGSGALITADLALDYGRDVFAVPGSVFEPTFEGCHKIIAAGQAKLVGVPDDVLKEWGAVSIKKEESGYAPEDPHQKAVFDALTLLPKSQDELAEETGLSASSIGVALTMLELDGAVTNAGGNRWTRR